MVGDDSSRIFYTQGQKQLRYKHNYVIAIFGNSESSHIDKHDVDVSNIVVIRSSRLTAGVKIHQPVSEYVPAMY